MRYHQIHFQASIKKEKTPRSYRRAFYRNLDKKTKSPAQLRGAFFSESGWRDSNSRPHAPQTCTLTGLSYIPIVVITGFEPVTSALSRQRSKPTELNDPSAKCLCRRLQRYKLLKKRSARALLFFRKFIAAELHLPHKTQACRLSVLSQRNT